MVMDLSIGSIKTGYQVLACFLEFPLHGLTSRQPVLRLCTFTPDFVEPNFAYVQLHDYHTR